MAKKRVRTDLRMVAAAYLATAAAPLLSTLLAGGAITGTLLFVAFLGAALSTLAVWLFAIPTGRVLARVVWRRTGTHLQRRVLSFAAKRLGPRRILLTDRPDARAKERMRVLETAALAIGVNVLGITIVRDFLSLQATLVTGLALLATSLVLTTLLTPKWAFARLGMRRVRPRRLIVTPLSHEYGSVTRIADGALLLLAIGISTFTLRRLGATDAEAFIQVVTIIVPVSGFVLLTASFALRHHARNTAQEDEALAAHAKALGCVDMRGASDDELAAALVRAA